MRFVVYSLLFLTAGCSSMLQIDEHHTSYLRRMPQMNKIETGRAVPEGSFVATAQCSRSIDIPDVMLVTDRSVEKKTTILGDNVTVFTSSNAYCYESRYMLCGEAYYAFSDVMATGVSLDASGGHVYNVPDNREISINNDCIEGSIIIRFAKKFGNIGVALKPELVLIHLYGDRFWKRTVNGGDARTATENIDYYTLGVRSSSVICYTFANGIAPYVGLQIKSQQLPEADQGIYHEIAYGMYSGIEYQYAMFSVSPYLAVPLGASMSHYTSPIAIGVQCAVMLSPDDW